LGVLKPLWQSIPETASRLRGRIEAVLDFAKARGLRSGENPALWKGNLAHLLPKRAKSRGHHGAMDYADVPAFVAGLRSLESVAARALEFVILTAGRSGEVRFAKWYEIDIDAKVWTVPAGRMKMGQVHRVPLCDRAVAIIEEQATYRCNDFIFPGRLSNQAIGENVMSMLCPDGATVHGFRSSFRDWCGDQTSFPREIAEAALAHAVGNAVEAAYRRGDALEKRRALMESWASYCEPDSGGNVIPIRTTL
jgi:integrase